MSNIQVKKPKLIIENNQVKTDSLAVAKHFNKNHHHLLEKIKTLDCSEDFNLSNFRYIDYEDSKGRQQPKYEITKDGFMFLVMGFTGKNAAVWKEAYIEAFNKMEKALAEKSDEAPIMLEHKNPEPEKLHYPIESLLVEGNGKVPEGPVVISSKFLINKSYRSPLMNLISDVRAMGHNVDGCYHEYLAMQANLERENRVATSIVESVNRTMEMNQGYGGYVVSV